MFDHSTPSAYDEDAAYTVLAALIADPSLLTSVSARLSPADFPPQAYRPCFEALLSLQRAGSPVTISTLRIVLSRTVRDLLTAPAGAAVLNLLTDLEDEPAPERLVYESALSNLRALSGRRDLVTLAIRIAGLASDLTLSPAVALASMRDLVLASTPAPAPAPLVAAPLLSARALHDRPDTTPLWLLDRLFLAGGVNLLAGEVASGKTFLALDLALSVAASASPWGTAASAPDFGGAASASPCGTPASAPSFEGAASASPWGTAASAPDFGVAASEPPVDSASLQMTQGVQGTSAAASSKVSAPIAWDARPCLSGPVLYCCQDSAPRTIRARLHALCAGRSLPPPENLFFEFSVLNLAAPADLDRLQSIVQANRIVLVIFDVLARYLPGLDENSVSSVGPIFTSLRSFTSSTGAAILVIHHFNKSASFLPPTARIHRVRGSSDIIASVDAALSVTLSGTRAHPRRTITPEKNRDLPEDPPFDFSIQPGAVSGSLVLQFSAPPAPADAAVQPSLLERLVAHLQSDSTLSLTRPELQLRLDSAGRQLSVNTLNRLFKELSNIPGVAVDHRGMLKTYRWLDPSA